ncbi:hypothetical protein D9M71_793470 [compost metagenome]
MIARLAGLSWASSRFQPNSRQNARWNTAKPRLWTPARRTSNSAVVMVHQPVREGRGDTHIAMVAWNTSTPAASVTLTFTGRS